MLNHLKTPNRILLIVVFILNMVSIELASQTQDLQHQTSAINIEVQVRVFQGDTFINNLILEDFEVYEDGVLQKVEAVYLVNKNNIEREETAILKEQAYQIFSPEVSRHFVLMFEIMDHMPQLDEAIDYFFQDIITPIDTLHVVTPVNTYHFKPEALAQMPKEKISKQLKSKLRSDIIKGSLDYKSAMRSLEKIFTFGVDPDLQRSMFVDQARILKDLRSFSEERMETLADFLKAQPGQKQLFLFYQSEQIPLLSTLDDYQKLELIEDLFFDLDKVKQLFSDSSISAHFLYVTLKNNQDWLNTPETMMPLRVEYYDQSNEIYNAFKEIARTTGGIIDSSKNPGFLFRKAADASENYYLLYYTPKNYLADGTFKKIEVKVKGEKYSVTHREGYFAD
ncbi:MAG: hypothetical protein JW755_01350 [Candidatus Aminicenantes bacterium]|nr:hypothetical protein [Candidatus Aminicenantes bacterium]